MNNSHSYCRAEVQSEPMAGVSGHADTPANSLLQRKPSPRRIEATATGVDTDQVCERMRQAIEATDLAVWDYDLETGWVHLSDAWSWLLGGSREPMEVPIETLTELVPEQDREMVRTAIIRAVKGEGASEYHVTHRVTKRDGGIMWVQSEGRVVQRDPAGRALRMIGVNRDVTEREILLDQLLSREARYRAVLDATVDGFMIIDLEGRLLEVNDVYVRESGYSRAELLRMRLSDIEATENAAEIATHGAQVRDAGHDRFESEHRRKDGSVWPVEVEVTYSRELDLSFVFVVDNTERKRWERRMAEHRAELDALQRSQVAAQTAAAFAHELNQPLSAIVSYAEAALMMLQNAEPDLQKVRDTIKKGRDQTLRAGNSIREMLTLIGADLESAEPLDLNREIRLVLNLARAETGLKFQGALKLERTLPRVRVNRVHLKKVLLNLLKNAVEAMRVANVPEPSVIVTVSTRRDEGLALVTVADNGPGISPANVARLFRPFFTTKQKGIGMGLAISRSLIEANGGQLWCDPGEGTGAVFHLTLPLAE